VMGVFYGIKPAVVAIVLFAAYRIGSRALKNQWLWLISLASFLAIAVFNVPFPIIVLIAVVLGCLGGHYFPAIFGAQGGHQASTVHYGRALIDDDTPTPAHARLSKRYMLNILIVGLGLWCLVMGWLFLRYGWYGTLTQMGWFFTKAALLTFGGAYAVLPYVYQGAVDYYQWLTPTQMIDGFALGETTPGPLIMIVAFVGFVGGWSQQLFGSIHPIVAGVAAASVVTFFTFLPSFLFIFIGAPFIESTQGNLRLTAPLLAITAAVVGVIISLALFFAVHVFKPELIYINQLTVGGIDLLAVMMALIGFIALFRYKLSVIKLIFISGLIGYLATLVLK
jgi:chromate transporter